MRLKLFDPCFDLRSFLLKHLVQFNFLFSWLTPGRNLIFEIFPGHRNGTVQQISEIVRKLSVVTCEHQIFGEIRIFSITHFSQQEIAQPVDSNQVFHFQRIDDVAQRLAHLTALNHPMPMDGQFFENRETRSLEHAGPVDSVGFENILADHMMALLPKLLITGVLRPAQCSDIIQQRIEPDVRDKIIVERKVNSPFKPAFRP